MNSNIRDMITTVEQLDSYINWLTENRVITTYQGGTPEYSPEMRQLMDWYTQLTQLSRTQDPEITIKGYANILGRYPKFVAARYNMAHALKQMGRFEEALEHYQLAAQYSPSDPSIYIELGDVYYRLGEKGSEMVSYFQALVLAPERDVAIIWQAIKNIGQTFGELQQYQKSLKFLKLALDIASENSKYGFSVETWNNEFLDTYLELGNTYKCMGNYQQSEEMYLKGVKLAADAKSVDPSRIYRETLIWSAITDLYLQHNQFRKAEQYAQKCVDRYPKDQIFQSKLRDAKSEVKPG